MRGMPGGFGGGGGPLSRMGGRNGGRGGGGLFGMAKANIAAVDKNAKDKVRRASARRRRLGVNCAAAPSAHAMRTAAVPASPPQPRTVQRAVPLARLACNAP